MQITTNVAALNAQRNLNVTGLKMGKVLEKLSSGYRINRAADDAAGLAISEKMRAQIRGNQQAVRNAQDGISMLQTAEGALDETHAILQRMRELAVQAANGTYADSSAERTSIGEELMQLRSEIDRISEATQFNGQKLLNGNLSTSVDAASGIVVGEELGATGATVSGIDVSGANAGTTYTFTYTAATDTLTLTDNTTLQADSVVLGALAGSATVNFEGLGVSLDLSGTDTADNIGAAIAGAGNLVTAAGSGSASLHIGANTTLADNTLTINFADMSAETIGITAALFGASNTVVATQADARNVIDAVDSAIGNVNSQRGSFGAFQNRLEHTIKSLGVAVENLSAAESRIRDADIAELSSKMVSNQILQQAGVSVLAQANSAPQSALSLLQ
jgi:flagellin